MLDIPMTFMLPPECLDKGMGFLKYTHYGEPVNVTKEKLKELVPSQYFAPTACLAIDCEMVGVGPLCDSALARVSIVNEYGYCIYDKFVVPDEVVTDFRTAKSGIHENDLVERGQPKNLVIKRVKRILEDCILVGHSVHNDLEVLDYDHPKEKTRDTADYFKSLSQQFNSLRALTQKYLNVNIQDGEHSSIQDAQATMKLYLIHREAWEKDLRSSNREARSPNNIKTMTCYPRKFDLVVNSDEVFLRKNKTIGAFNSAAEYLDIQFRLLREDFMRPLRLGFKECRAQGYQGVARNKRKVCTPSTVRVFTNVTLRRSAKGELKGTCQLHIPVGENKLDLIQWEESKCLINGSLVILTPDNFKSVKVAAVRRFEDNPNESTLKQGIVNILCFPDGPSWTVDSTTKFTMIESVAFFEAYGPTLSCLQQMDLGTFPMCKYIVDGVTVSRIVKYRQEVQYIDFSRLIKGGGIQSSLTNINNVATWPSASQFGFNPSQYQAFQAALTQELAIIQGPPGTGKTFLGLQLMKAFLSNPDLMTSPILVIAHTNHALDNILEPVLKFARQITGSENRGNELVLRVGGGSKSEEIKKVTLMAKNDMVSMKLTIRDTIKVADKGIKAAEDFVNTSAYETTAKEVVENVSKIQKFLLTSLVIFKVDGIEKPDLEYQELILSALANFLSLWSNTNYKVKPTKAKPKKLNNVKGLFETAMSKAADIDTRPSVFPAPNRSTSFTIQDVEEIKLLQKIIRGVFVYLRKRHALVHRKWLLLQDVNPQFMSLAKIIGMTSTGAAKNKGRILEVYKPSILLVEEAAHVLESHVVAALTVHCKQMILIGDHQQLRPGTADYHLTQNYGLDVSLMERLVENGKAQGNQNWVQLNVQHRMRPEIARLVCPAIYADLQNHESVSKYPDVIGVTKNLFFLNHRFHDKREDESPSHFNEHEAEFTSKLCRYFIQQGYKAGKISIITTYMGQKLLLEKKLRKEPSCKDVRICCVDGFQGEENDIILLSLVRSNAANSIGFLETDNRVCVALSRAKHGCFIIGNMEGLAERSNTWRQIHQTLLSMQSIGEHLSLKCFQHGTITKVSTGACFDNFSSAGCFPACRSQNEQMQKTLMIDDKVVYTKAGLPVAVTKPASKSKTTQAPKVESNSNPGKVSKTGTVAEQPKHTPLTMNGKVVYPEGWFPVPLTKPASKAKTTEAPEVNSKTGKATNQSKHVPLKINGKVVYTKAGQPLIQRASKSTKPPTSQVKNNSNPGNVTKSKTTVKILSFFSNHQKSNAASKVTSTVTNASCVPKTVGSVTVTKKPINPDKPKNGFVHSNLKA